MLSTLASRSGDLLRLQDDGYEVEIRYNYLLVKHVPFVTADRTVAYGILISELSTDGTSTVTPATHVVGFAGGVPCDKNGAELTEVVHAKEIQVHGPDLIQVCTLSNKPPEGYPDYYAKMTGYINMISGWAQALDPDATARTFAPIETTEDESVFRYLDSASSRAGISHITAKLALPRVAIVGLGGTGSFILDQVTKTPVQEIHLFDGDRFLAHNAFRAPGAASIDELVARPYKTEFFADQYDPLRRGIVSHPVDIDADNVSELREMSFVFLALDSGEARRLIVESLEDTGTPFIDCGVGVYERDGSLGGALRVTTSTDGARGHVWEKDRIPFDDGVDDEYDRNIQIADLNTLNAVLAVIKWKKLCGFYSDLDHEMHMMYTISGNHLANEDPLL